MGAEIKLTCIGVPRSPLFFHEMKKFLRRTHFHSGAPFQILLPAYIFQMIPGRASAAVSIAKGQQERLQILLLAPVLPHVSDLLRIRTVGIAGRQEGYHLRSVHSLPCEIMIGETFPVIAAPKYFLCHQIFYAEACQDLGKRRAIAKGIRQPEHIAFHPQDLLIVPLAMQQLTYQGFSSGEIGIRLHPHGPISNPVSLFDCIPDPFK